MNKLSNQVRIIAGKYRGRKIHFPSIPNLRPTSDRIRETLFNWLAPVIRGSTCLDLFAGSGALSIEALSRGAKEVILLEQNKEAMHSLLECKKDWEIDGLKLIQIDCREFLKTEKQKNPNLNFDVIFLDPPYQSILLKECIDLLEQHHWMNTNTLLYFETDKPQEVILPAHWKIIREKKAGQVSFYLVQPSRTTDTPHIDH